jgi:putative FmdB family regulatory protein
MIYVYHCNNCSHEFDVVKSVKEIDNQENCEKCGSVCERIIRFRGYFLGEKDWDKAEYNPGLGCVTKNAKHRKQIAKERGLEEIGTTKIDDFKEQSDKRLEENRQRVYDSIRPEL